MEGVFPNKFYEYMALEIPVVTTALVELKPYADFIGYSYNKEEFLINCRKAINGEFKEKVKYYSKIAQENSWRNRAKVINQKLQDILNT